MLNNRKTIRKYSDKDIPSELLNRLLEESFRSSTMGGMQIYSVVITRDKKMRKNIFTHTFQ